MFDQFFEFPTHFYQFCTPFSMIFNDFFFHTLGQFSTSFQNFFRSFDRFFAFFMYYFYPSFDDFQRFCHITDQFSDSPILSSGTHFVLRKIRQGLANRCKFFTISGKIYIFTSQKKYFAKI